jgi:peptide-methionine (S)-S-oxide reductase
VEYQAVDGIERCLVGYAGGTAPNPTYQNIQDYTEALLIEFDPTVISYRALLGLWKDMHSPYPSNRQYRSAVLTTNAAQDEVAREFCQKIQFVDIEPATTFYLAEEYHQNFLQKQRAGVFG